MSSESLTEDRPTIVDVNLDTSRRSVVLLGLMLTSQGRQHVFGFGPRAETYFGQQLEETWFENA